MEKLIACCGLNCETCDARIATINNDDALRAATAEKWKIQYNAPDIAPETINCTGCRTEGVKFAHCTQCEIRNCIAEKGYDTCGDCSDITDCEKVKPVHQFLPEAINNLKSLK